MSRGNALLSTLEQLEIMRDLEEEHGEEAVEEYRRWMVLKALDKDVRLRSLKHSPPGAVDAVWHSHMMRPQSYLLACNTLLEKVDVVFEHDPKTAGRADRDARHAHSRRRYEEVWGREPPAGVWDERGGSDGGSSHSDGEPGGKERGAVAAPSGPSSALAGLSFSLTGTFSLPGLPQYRDIADLITRHGGACHSPNMRSDTMFLVVGKAPAVTRVGQAEMWRIKAISIAVLLSMILSPSAAAAAQRVSGAKRSAPSSSSAPAEPQAKRRGRGENQFYRVYAKTLTGKVIALDICAYWTIRNVKEAIRDKEGMPPDFQRLIFCGRQLEDEQTCEDCEVRVGSTFHLVSKLRGC